MGVYGKAIITTAGRNLIAQALAGNESVRFTELKTSDYKYASTASLDALTDIPNVKQTTDITSALVTANSNVKVSAMIRNSGLTAAYYINTIGIYGNTPGFPDTLIAVISAVTGDLVPAYSGSPFSFVFDVNLIIQNASNLNVSVNDAGVATVADLNALWKKAYDVYITNEVSGDVVTFPDGADMIPMKSVSVNFSPLQPLNGYSKPWGPGMGENVFPYLSAKTATFNGVTFSYDGVGTFTMTGTATGNDFVSFFFPTPFVIPDGTTYKICFLNNEAHAESVLRFMNGSTIVDSWQISTINRESEYVEMGGKTATGIRLYCTSGMTYNLTMKPMFVLKTETVTSYIPYANICPISGHDSVTITRTGKNQLPSNPSKLTINGVTFTTNADGTVNTSGTATGTANRTIYNGYFPAGEYVLTGCPTGGGTSSYQIWIYDMTDRVAAGIEDRGSGATGTLVEGHQYDVRIRYAGGYEANQTFYPMIRLASITDATYEPYQSNSYTTNFADAVGTVYGGALDVVSGALTITDANIASYAGETLPGEWLSSYDVYAPGTTPTNGAQVVYKRSTPVVSQVDPKDIYSVYGINIAWSDQNNIDVAYRADTKLYIDAKIAETQALALENS